MDARDITLRPTVRCVVPVRLQLRFLRENHAEVVCYEIPFVDPV